MKTFFYSSLAEKKKKYSYFTSNEKSRKIIEYLKRNDFGITKTHLSSDLEMHHNYILKYLKVLEEINVIVRKKAAKQTLCFLNEDLFEPLHLNV